MKLLQRWKQTALHNQVLGLTGVLVAFGTVFYAASAAFQVWVMREAAKSTTEQTSKLIEAANKSAAAAKSFSNTATNVHATIKAEETDFRRMAKNAEDSLRATQQAFRADQRAWLGVGDYAITQFNDKDPFKLDIPILNSGKTPAVKSEKAIFYVLTTQQLSSVPEHAYMFEPTGAIPPQGHNIITITNYEVPTRYEAIVTSKSFLYFFGEIRYHDVNTSVMHHTRFCLIYQPRTKGMSFCLFGNEMD